MRLKLDQLPDNLSRINELAGSGSIQMLQVDCRQRSDASWLAWIENVEIVAIVSDRPVVLPGASVRVEGVKALYCTATSIDCGAFPDLEFLRISDVDFSRSEFGGAGLKRLYASNFKPRDGASRLSAAGSLEDLDLMRSRSLKSLEVVSGLSNLKRLSLSHLPGVTSLAPISRLTQLETLVLVRMKAIESYRPISQLDRLRRLVITDSAKIDWLSSAQTSSLEILGVHGTKLANQNEA